MRHQGHCPGSRRLSPALARIDLGGWSRPTATPATLDRPPPNLSYHGPIWVIPVIPSLYELPGALNVTIPRMVTWGSEDFGNPWPKEVMTWGSDDLETFREVVTLESGDFGKWWPREVVTWGSDDVGTCRPREVMTWGSDLGKWRLREAVASGSRDFRKWCLIG